MNNKNFGNSIFDLKNFYELKRKKQKEFEEFINYSKDKIINIFFYPILKQNKNENQIMFYQRIIDFEKINFCEQFKKQIPNITKSTTAKKKIFNLTLHNSLKKSNILTNPDHIFARLHNSTHKIISYDGLYKKSELSQNIKLIRDDFDLEDKIPFNKYVLSTKIESYVNKNNKKKQM